MKTNQIKENKDKVTDGSKYKKCEWWNWNEKAHEMKNRRNKAEKK